jgi:hypothetical protein
MKTIKLIALAIFALAVFNSCEVDNPEVIPEENPEQWYTENLEVKAQDWNLEGGRPGEIGSYYEYIFDGFPYVDGIITVYMYRNYRTPAEVQVPLPYTEYIAYDENGDRKFYSIQYSYDIAIDGTIAFKIHVSDDYTSEEDITLQTLYFRVAIIY